VENSIAANEHRNLPLAVEPRQLGRLSRSLEGAPVERDDLMLKGSFIERLLTSELKVLSRR